MLPVKKSFLALLVAFPTFLVSCQRSKGPVVAQVGDIAITASEFSDRLQQTPEGYQQYVASVEGRRQFLKLMIREKILLYQARRAGLQHDATYHQGIADFKTQMQHKVKDYEESLLVQTYLRRLRSTELSVKDGDVQKYYDEHQSYYQHPMEVQASHILLSSSDEAQSVLNRLKNGESFEALARTLSRDPGTASRGGKLTPFKRGSLVPEFEEAAFRLKVGETSGIIKTLFGYHIIRKTGDKMLPSEPFDAVKEDIRARLEREKFDHWVNDQQSALAVHIDDKAMAAVAMPVAPAAPPSEEPVKP